MESKTSRRTFLKDVALAGAAASGVTPVPATAQPISSTQQQAGADSHDGYTFLSADEGAFIEAFVDVLVPADELTPSGVDLGLATFIDRQLSGAWGKGDRMYRQGPWQEGVPGQGYQLPLTPADFFRAGIHAVNQYCKTTFNKEFDRLASSEKQKVLQDLDQSKVTLDRISGKQFFDTAYQAVMEGMFADPVYGGNKDKAAWKMIGYPGVIAVHATNITTFKNKQYVAPTLGIADLL